jgi:hypothetical protein
MAHLLPPSPAIADTVSQERPVMLPEEDARVGRIAEALRSYLRAHPMAADSLEGITQWWLPGDLIVTAAQVEAALDRLLADGEATSRTVAGGVRVYSRS